MTDARLSPSDASLCVACGNRTKTRSSDGVDTIVCRTCVMVRRGAEVTRRIDPVIPFPPYIWNDGHTRAVARDTPVPTHDGQSQPTHYLHNIPQHFSLSLSSHNPCFDETTCP